jgi:hypothetical protein
LFLFPACAIYLRVRREIKWQSETAGKHCQESKHLLLLLYTINYYLIHHKLLITIE